MELHVEKMRCLFRNTSLVSVIMFTYFIYGIILYYFPKQEDM